MREALLLGCVRLREHESFNENSKGFGRPRELRDAVEEDVLQYLLNAYSSKHPSLQHVT